MCVSTLFHIRCKPNISLNLALSALLCYNTPKAVIFTNMKAAIFDMDGTLVDSLMLWDVLWSTFGEIYLNDKSFVPSVEDDKKVRTLTLKDAMYLIHKNYKLGESGEDLLSLANSIMNDFYANRVELKDGVRAFLEHCKNNGVKMCIASATTPELIDVALEHCDIGKYFLKVFRKRQGQTGCFSGSSQFLRH